MPTAEDEKAEDGLTGSRSVKKNGVSRNVCLYISFIKTRCVDRLRAILNGLPEHRRCVAVGQWACQYLKCNLHCLMSI